MLLGAESAFRAQKGTDSMPKNPYESIPEDWKEEVEKKSISEINNLIADLAKRQEENEKAMKEDQALEEIKWKVKEAKAPYSEAKNALKAKIKFAIEMLEAKGGH